MASKKTPKKISKKKMFIAAALSLVAIQGVIVASDYDLGLDEGAQARVNEGIDQNTVLGLGIVVGLVAIPLVIQAVKETVGVF